MIAEIKRELELLWGTFPKREFHVAARTPQGRVEFKGRSLVDFCSWDYLNLARHDRVKRAAHEAIEQCGVGTAAARGSSGTFSPHLSAEVRLSAFLGTDASLLFSSRSQAGLSLLTTLVGERDAVFAEEDLSLPAADASYLVNAPFQSFARSDFSRLAADLERASGARRRIILAETVSASRGDVLELVGLLELCSRFDAFLVLDETCALSALGVRGAGLLESQGFSRHPRIISIINSLECLAGVSLGSVSGRSELVLLVSQRSRALGSEVSPSPAVAASLVTALDIVELQSHERIRLIESAARLERGISEIFKRIPSPPSSPIVTIPCEKFGKALALSEALFSRNILAEAVQHRGMLSQQGSVRFLINSALDDAAISSSIRAVSEVYARVVTAA